MNIETYDLVERPYLEVVDDLLTALVGGVVNEPRLYDARTELYPLAEPARAVRAVTGTREGRHHAFLPEVDFQFREGENAVVWRAGGDRPDDDTLFYVDYYRRDGRSPLTDVNVGSVTRTLAEAVGREIATVYQQIRLAHRAGFLDTAEGKALDLVVSILGIERKTGELAEGLVTFYRDPAIEGDVHIPQVTRLGTAKGKVVFETSQPRMLQRGQARIDVPVRAASEFAGEAGWVDAGAITTLIRPLAGVARVTNLEPTTQAAADESDDELRQRARIQLRALGRGTVAALDRVVREGRGTPLEVWDPAGPPSKRSTPGTVTLLVDAAPERLPGLRAAVHQTRAAGVVATVVARHVVFKPYLVARIPPGLPAAGKEKIQREMQAALAAYVAGLASGEPADGRLMLETLASVADVQEPRFRDGLAWRSDVDGGEAGDRLDTLVAAAESASDADGLRPALARALADLDPGSTAPTGRRVLDRSLLRASSGGSPDSAALAAGDFQVIAEVDGEPWWVALDLDPADIELEEGEG